VVALCTGVLVTVEACTNGGPLRRGLAVGAVAIVLTLLVVTTLELWAALVFPGWVLVVSGLFLVRSYTAGADPPTPDATGSASGG
jgi:hypothetical protein